MTQSDRMPWAVVDLDSAGPGERAVVLACFQHEADALWYLETRPAADVERGRYALDGPPE